MDGHTHLFVGRKIAPHTRVIQVPGILTFIFALLLPAVSGAALNEVVDLSRFNARRPELAPRSVTHIVLHTTEGSYPGCLEKLKRFGEAHFLVRENGVVIRLMDLDRLAKHAGRSVWDGQKSLDHSAIGIEVEGTWSKPPTVAQREALRELLADLRTRFNVPDERVLTHSMVAYGAPNRYFDEDHRGRKRCGMMMARADVRRDLGLVTKANEDPDVMAEELIIADEPLFAFLYNPRAKFDLFRNVNRTLVRNLLDQLHLPPSTLLFTRNNRPARPERVRPPQVQVPLPPKRPDFDYQDGIVRPPLPPPRETFEANVEHDGDRPEFLEVGPSETAWSLAGNQYAADTTIYFFRSGVIRTGKQLQDTDPYLLTHLPRGTRILVGYVYGGRVDGTRTPSKIVGVAWNDPSTIYSFPNHTLKTGDEVNDRGIPPGTTVLFQR